MAELHVVSALRSKRAELAGMVGQLEQQLARQRTNLALQAKASIRSCGEGLGAAE
jgi:hypothetical protein